MLETVNNTFKYKGNVVIKLNINGKIVTLENHNTGTENLQRSFCKFVTNNLVPADDLPQFIDLEKSTDSTEWEPALISKLPISGREWSEASPGEYVATLTCSIEYSDLISSITTTGTYQYFRLVLKSAQYDLAYLSVDVADAARIVPGIQAIVQWSMQLTEQE